MVLRAAPKGEKSIYFEVGAWYDENMREIHLTCVDDPDGRFHVRLRNDPESTAHHGSLYNNVKRLLQSQDRWPASAGE